MRRAFVVALAAVVAAGALGDTMRRPETAPGDLSLTANAPVPFQALLAHVRSANPGIDEIYLRTLYRNYRELCRLEGISLVSALAQMVHETDYLRFSGSVRGVQYNYAGIGAVAADHPGERFPDMRTGVAAHVQHLKAYAATTPLVTELVDPRFHLVRRGTATTVMSLTGRWATDPHYGPKVLAHAAALLRYASIVESGRRVSP